VSDPQAPALRVVRGDATADEVAAIVAVLMARQAARERAARAAAAPALARGAHIGGRTVRSSWRDRSSLLRSPVTPGPGGWRASALPGY
jgi:acyl-CoA carboxylase epsilon subunit